MTVLAVSEAEATNSDGSRWKRTYLEEAENVNLSL